MGIAPVVSSSSVSWSRQGNGDGSNGTNSTVTLRIGNGQYGVEQAHGVEHDRTEESTGCCDRAMQCLRNWCRSVRDFFAGCWRSVSGANRRGDYDFSASGSGVDESQGNDGHQNPPLPDGGGENWDEVDAAPRRRPKVCIGSPPPPPPPAQPSTSKSSK